MNIGNDHHNVSNTGITWLCSRSRREVRVSGSLWESERILRTEVESMRGARSCGAL